jgi:N-acetylglucosaminyl-diphospho-decaprenol L-rhamnosyltransferase
MTEPTPVFDPAGLGVTVVVPHYGSPSVAERLVVALQAQHTNRPLQVVVVDDASPEPFHDQAGLTVIRQDHNGGFGTAVNAGVALAKHPLLLILNSDLEIGHDFVDRLVTEAESRMPAVVGPRIVDGAGEDTYSGRRFPSVAQYTTEWLVPLARWRSHSMLHRAVGHDVRCQPGQVRTVDWLVGAALLVPTDSFRSVGGFDEGFFMNCEEVDLQRRLLASGVPSIYIGTVSAKHEAGGSSAPDARLGWIIGSRLRYAEKWGGRWRFRLALTAATVVNFGWNSARALRDQRVHPVDEAVFHLRLLWGGPRRQSERPAREPRRRL